MGKWMDLENYGIKESVIKEFGKMENLKSISFFKYLILRSGDQKK